MSPVSPAAVAQASLSWITGLLSARGGPFLDLSPITPTIVDFNGSITQLPPPTGPFRVGIHDFVVEDYNGDRLDSSPVCEHTTEAQLRKDHGENGALYYREVCEGPRHIPVSMFYPACEFYGGTAEFAPVFSESLLSVIQRQVFGGSKAIHNVMSQAVRDAHVCSQPDTSSVFIFNPPMGGQRQAYTQIASDVASYGYMVLSLDHSLLSGAVEFGGEPFALNLAHEMIQDREAVHTYMLDMAAVLDHLTKGHTTLWSSSSGVLGINVDFNKTCIFGHGLGGLVASAMKTEGIVTCGGRLSGGMPAPYTADDVFFTPTPNDAKGSTKKPGSSEKLEDIVHAIRGPLLENLKKMARGIGQNLMDAFSSTVCHFTGICGSPVHKRD